MNDNVVNYKHRSFDQSPVEGDIIIWGAGPPAIAVFDNLDLSEIDTELSGMTMNPWNYLFISLKYMLLE